MECELQRNINYFILWTPLHGPPVPGNTLGVRHVNVFLPYSQDVSAGIRGEYVAAPYSSRIPKTSRIIRRPCTGPPVPGNTLGVRHVNVFLPYSQDVSAGIRGEYAAAPYSSRIPKTSRIIRRPYTVSFCGGIRISAAFLGDSQVLKVRWLIALRYCVGHSSTKAILVAPLSQRFLKMNNMISNDSDRAVLIQASCELLSFSRANQKQSHAIGPYAKPPTYRHLQVELMRVFGLEVSPLLAFKRNEQWIALESDAEVIRAFRMTQIAWQLQLQAHDQEKQRVAHGHSSATQVEETLRIPQRPELTLLLTSYDSVDGRGAAASFAKLLNNVEYDPDILLRIPLHCRHCKRLQDWTLQLSHILCGDVEGPRKKRRRATGPTSSCVREDSHASSSSSELSIQILQRHNESCRVTIANHAKNKCPNTMTAQLQGPLDRFCVRAVRAPDGPKASVVSFNKEDWGDDFDMVFEPEVQPGSDGSAADDVEGERTETIGEPSAQECSCALPYGKHIPEDEAMMLPYSDIHAVKPSRSRARKFAYVPTPSGRGDRRGKPVFNENQIHPTTIFARNPSSDDYWRKLGANMKLPIELNEEQEVTIQAHLRKCDERDLLTRQDSNRRLVKQVAARRKRALLSLRLKRSRATSYDCNASHDGRNREKDNDYDAADYEDEQDEDADMRDGMRLWPLPRVIQLNVPANTSLRARSLTVTAVLMYMDSPYDCANGVERINYPNPVRACEFHRIVSVEPDDGRFTRYLGHMFSSLDVSYQLFASKGQDYKSSGWSAWNDVLTQTNLSDLAQWGAFCNPPHMDQKPLCRDYCASLCVFECTDVCLSKKSSGQANVDQEDAPNHVRYAYDIQLDCVHEVTRESTRVHNQKDLNTNNGCGMIIWDQSTNAQKAQCTVKFWDSRAASYFLCIRGGNPDFVEPKPVSVSGREAWRIREEMYMLEDILGIASNHTEIEENDSNITITPDTILVTQWVNRRDPADQPTFEVKVADFPPQRAVQKILQSFIGSFCKHA